VTVDGEGSTWTNSRSLYVGEEGDATLTITNGGTVSVADTIYVDRYDSSAASINFGAGGGTLATESIYCSASQLWGTGTINTRGIVSNVDLVLDGGGLVSTLSLPIASQDGGEVTLNLDLSDTASILGSAMEEMARWSSTTGPQPV